MAKTQIASQKASKYADLQKRVLFLVLALIVFRLGTHIPVPGIDSQALKSAFGNQSGGVLNFFNMFSGGALKRFSIFALGIMPYISSSIILQLLTSVIPALDNLKKEGESGRSKISQYTRYGTVLLSLVQAFGIAATLQAQPGLVINPGPWFVFTTCVSLVTGTMFVMWLGEQITERGLGNGISVLIFAGIVAGLFPAIAQSFQMVSNGSLGIGAAILIFAIVLAVIVLVVYFESAQRRITVNYAKRVVGNKMYGGQTSHLPLKLNMAGVIPPIFASSIILFPATLATWFAKPGERSWLSDIAAALSQGQPLYIILFTALVIFFCYFYTALMFNSRETADNLKKSGAFVPGIRPGLNTARYIDKILMRLTLVGSIYITLICLLPEFLRLKWSNIPFYFGGTSLLIIVVVAMDFMVQVQSYMMSYQYDSMFKKQNKRK
ncbi:MAG: preprotein translocase subunit SecY [Alcaligenaceae bacterium]|nr:preprotein translocase subunit SecY [Alcaligenaceae bacterium]